MWQAVLNLELFYFSVSLIENLQYPILIILPAKHSAILQKNETARSAIEGVSKKMQPTFIQDFSGNNKIWINLRHII